MVITTDRLLLFITSGAGLVGITLFVFLPAFPETCSFLNPADRVLAVLREQEGYAQEATFVTRTTHINTKKRAVKFNFEQCLELVKDLQIWLAVLQVAITVLVLDYVGILIPQSHLLMYPTPVGCTENCQDVLSIFLFSMAPYIVAVPCSFYASKYADQTHDRSQISLGGIFMGACGFLIVTLVPNNMTGYILGAFPCTVAMICVLPCLIAQCGDIAVSETHKSTVGALIGVFGFGFGHLISTILRIFVSDQSSAMKYILILFILSLIMICYVKFGPPKSNNENWDRAPGLRRLMNDTEEANAWGIELEDKTILKTSQLKSNETMQGKSYETTPKFESIAI